MLKKGEGEETDEGEGEERSGVEFCWDEYEVNFDPVGGGRVTGWELLPPWKERDDRGAGWAVGS